MHLVATTVIHLVSVHMLSSQPRSTAVLGERSNRCESEPKTAIRPEKLRSLRKVLVIHCARLASGPTKCPVTQDRLPQALLLWHLPTQVRHPTLGATSALCSIIAAICLICLCRCLTAIAKGGSWHCPCQVWIGPKCQQITPGIKVVA